MTTLPPLNLRRLEMAMPLIKVAQDPDPKAFSRLAGLALADDATIKLAAAGNMDALRIFTDQACDMPLEEVAEVLHFFTRASERFSLIVDGLRPEEVNQVMANRDQKLRVKLDLEYPAE